ncbi:DEAD/DEAH box helicase, partial [Ostertagia ostertagi]
EHEDNDGHASLRLRVLPENIKEELRNLRKRQSGEQILVETKEDDQVEEGSGKTLAFAIPVIMDVLKLKKLSKYKDGTKLLAVVLEPTRELASQTYRQFLKFGQGLPIKAALFENEEVPQNVDVLVSTPNRLAHHLQDMQLKFLRWLIVDESDRLFEVVEGQERCFRNQLASVYKACDGKFTRRAFFSATFSYEVEEWCKENLNNVAMVCIGERNEKKQLVRHAPKRKHIAFVKKKKKKAPPNRK